MGKTTRFFEIIQLLRHAKRPLLARELAEELEVSRRTIYRDIATLQSMQTPILGEPGVGYVMRKGYDLPPINFDIDEAEAVAVGLSMVARTGDIGLWRAAKRASRKLSEAAPGTQRLIASSWGVVAAPAVDMSTLRSAIRNERKISLSYEDANGAPTGRVVWPLVLIYYVDTAMLAGWCELRRDLRHFRLDRVVGCEFLKDGFDGLGCALIARWEETQKHATVSTKEL
jgi:predicted DNA-binding transcriptional regulator YafY